VTKKVNILLPIGESLGLVKATLAPACKAFKAKRLACCRTAGNA